MTWYIQQDDILCHHGVLGQRWGIRRYQNYDGSYTREGFGRYNQAKEDLDSATDVYKKGGMSKDDYKRFKKREKRAYKSLKRDYAADKGEKLYNKGYTIRGIKDSTGTKLAGGAGLAGTGILFASWYNTYKGRDVPVAQIATGVGLTSVFAGKKAINSMHIHQLKAYYKHNGMRYE